MKILVISLAGIGDTLMATPLIHELRANFPEAVIDVLVMWPAAKDILNGNPHVNNVYHKNLLKISRKESLQFLLGLRRHRYDISINSHPQSRVHYRLVARLINARKRVSHSYHRASFFDGILINRSLQQDYARHCIENNLALLPLIGAKIVLPAHDYELFLTSAELDWAGGFLQQANLNRPTVKKIGIHVGSGGTKNLALRRWPLANYQDLIHRLIKGDENTEVLLFGGPEEQAANSQILAATGSGRILTPPTQNIRQVAALLKSCDLFLSVDTALMHLAAAVKVPWQFVIETPSFNKTVEPFQQRFHVIKNPSLQGRNLDYYRYDGGGIRGTPEELLKCMSSVTSEQVYQAMRSALLS